MKIIASFIAILLASSGIAQDPIDSWIYGTWINQGYSYEGSFYPSNSWNEEKITLKPDYTFSKEVNRIENQIIDTVRSVGKWNYNHKNKKLGIYSDSERYSPQGKIILFDREYDLDFISDTYFTIKDLKGKYPVTIRFQKEGTIETFQESQDRERARIESLAIKYDENSSIYYLVNSLNPAKKKTMYFDEANFSVEYTESGNDPEIQEKNIHYSGTISNFTDSTITLNVFSESIDIEYHNGSSSSINNDYYFSKVMKKEIPLSKINVVYENKQGFDPESIAPTTFVLSAITTLIVAPLISINYKGGNFNQNRYYKTAGIGLIGVGVSIPIALIFRSKPIHFIPPGGETSKRNWQLVKVRL